MAFDDAPAAVHDGLERLRDEWGTVPVRERTERAPPGEYDPDYDDPFRYAGAWVRRDGEVLLVSPVVDEGWTNPGGEREPGESFAETARRETREETGVEVTLTGVVEAIVTRTRFGDRGTGWGFGVVFDARYAGGQARPEPGEIESVMWVESLPAPEDLVFPWVTEYPR